MHLADDCNQSDLQSKLKNLISTYTVLFLGINPLVFLSSDL